METYEKKYKEALENFKLFREAYKTTDNSITYKEMRELFANVENSFPELIESDDERLRKAMICGMNALKEQHKEKFASIPINDCIAWLEKQDKNNMGISEATKKKLEDNLNNALEKETPETWNKFLEKQGEKKSIESTKNKLNESMIKPDPNPYWTLAPEYKLMNEQKPAWSEEDEETINNLIDYLENEDDSSYTDLDKESFAKEIKLLKSLRLQNRWKPSEEQLNALHWCVMNVGSTEHQVLQELLEQLEKLKA